MSLLEDPRCCCSFFFETPKTMNREVGKSKKKNQQKRKRKKKVSQSISHSKEKETQIGRNERRGFHFLPKCSQKIEEKGENSNLFAMVIPHLAHTSESEKKTSQEPCVSVMGRKDKRGGEKAKNEELPFKKKKRRSLIYAAIPHHIMFSIPHSLTPRRMRK